MKKSEVLALSNGLYKVYWKSGGSSLCAVGILHNGDRWLAPTNWTGDGKVSFSAEHWKSVLKVKIIKLP